MTTIFDWIKNNKMMSVLIVAILFLSVICTIFTFGYIKTKSKLDYTLNNVTVANDSLKTYKNKNGELVSQISVFQSEKTKDFTKLQFQDETIKKLQALIIEKEKEGKTVQTALIIANNTIIQYQDSISNLIINSDTIHNSDSSITVYPIYNRKIDMFDKWITGDVTLGLKTFKINMNIENEYGITIGSDREHWYSKKQMYADVVNKNPLTKTKEMRVYNVQLPKQHLVTKFTIIILISIAIGKFIL